MKSALRIIARSRPDPAQAAVVLLQVAIEILDNEGLTLPAAHVSQALHTLDALCDPMPCFALMPVGSVQ